MTTIQINDQFSLAQALEAGQKIEHNGKGIVCTINRYCDAHERSKKLYTVGDLSTGKDLYTGKLADAVARFLIESGWDLPKFMAAK